MDDRHDMRRALLTAMGLGFYWPFSVLVGANVAFSSMSDVGVRSLGLWLPYLAVLSVALLMFVFHAKLGLDDPGMRKTVLMTTGGTAAVLAVSFAFTEDYRMVHLAGYAGLSAAVAIMLIFWGRILSGFSLRTSAVVISASTIIGSMLYFSLRGDANQVGAPSYYAALAVVSGGFLIFADTGNVQSNSYRFAPSSAGEPLSWRSSHPFIVIAALALCIFADEIIRILITSSDVLAFGDVGALTQISSVIVSLVILAGASISRNHFNLNKLFLVLVLLMVVGFVSFLIFPEAGVTLPVVSLGASYWMLNLFLWIVVADMVRVNGESALRLFAFMWAAINLALFASNPVGLALTDLFPDDADLTRPLAVVIILVVFASMLILWDRTAFQSGRDGGVDKRRDNFEDTTTSMETIAREHRLTPRETDVFLLIVRGRNLPVIQRELSVSRGTAQTHIRHIYEKFSVHSRQELLDLIDERKNVLAGR